MSSSIIIRSLSGQFLANHHCPCGIKDDRTQVVPQTQLQPPKPSTHHATSKAPLSFDWLTRFSGFASQAVPTQSLLAPPALTLSFQNSSNLPSVDFRPSHHIATPHIYLSSPTTQTPLAYYQYPYLHDNTNTKSTFVIPSKHLITTRLSLFQLRLFSIPKPTYPF